MNDLEERIIKAATATWQIIGPDVLRAAEADSIDRDEVVEVVNDYLEYGHDPEALAEFRQLRHEDRIAMLRKAFPLARYGW